MDKETQKLYKVLSREGYYTKSFEEFEAQFEDAEYRDKVFGVVSRDNLYTKSRDEFESKYYKKKEDTDSQSTGVQENTDFSFDEYPSSSEMYDIEQGTATPEVIQKANRFLSQDKDGVKFTPQQSQDYSKLKNLVNQSVKEEAEFDEGKSEGKPAPSVDLVQSMDVAGQRGRGEAVDGAPKKEYERSVRMNRTKEEIMISLQEQEDAIQNKDLLQMSQEDIDEYFERESYKRRRYSAVGEDLPEGQQGAPAPQAESIDDYEKRIQEDTLDRAKNGSIPWVARTITASRKFDKSLFETEDEYNRRINKLSDGEIKNAEYRVLQQGALDIQNQLDDGTLSENSLQVKDWVRRTAEEIGLDPDYATFESVSKSISDTKNFLEGMLFENSLDKALYKDYLQGKTGLNKYTFTKRATTDFVSNFINDIGIYISDQIVNDPITAERLQQQKTERMLRAKIALGQDPYDNKGIFETFQEEFGRGEIFGSAWSKLLLSTADSFTSMVAAVVSPEAGVALAAGSGGFGAYEAYRDRGDLTEAEKNSLAVLFGTIEGTITRIGMGNIRRARAAMGIADDIGTAALSARQKAYRTVIDKLSPISRRTAAALKSARGRAAFEGFSGILEEEAEELSIAILQQSVAHAIANDEFDPYELADVAISTLGMTSVTSGITAYKTYNTYRNLEITPTSDKIQKYESLKEYYKDLKTRVKEEGISDDEKSILKEEMSAVRDEIHKIKAESSERYENMTDAAVDEVARINRKIRKASRTAKKTDSPTTKDAAKRRIEALVARKAQIEGGASVEATTKPKGSIMTPEAKVIEATEQKSPEGTPLQTVQGFAEDLKAKLEARRDNRKEKETPSQALDTRVRYLNPATNETVEGVLSKDGQRLVVETDEGNIIDIENFDAVKDNNLASLNISPAEGLLGVNEDGSFTYNRAGGVAPQGTKMVNNNGVRAIRRDKNGEVKNVLLTSEDGSQTYNLKGEEAQEAAYQIALKESQNEQTRAKVDEEFRLQAIEDAKTEEKTEAPKATKPKQPTAKERVEQRKKRQRNIETVGDVQLDDNGLGKVSNMVDALGIVAPDIKVVMHSSRDSYNKTHPNANRDVGHWDGKNTIHVLVDGKNPLNVEGYMLLKHEIIHPILETIIASDPDFADRIESRIKSIMNRYAKGTPAQKRVLDHYGRYAKRSDQSLELLTEFVNVFSEPAGIKLLSRDKTALEKLADLFQMILDRIKGFRDGKVPSSKAEIIELTKQIGKALETGSALDIDKTLNTSRENAIRQSLERSSDPSKAYAPKQGASLTEVMPAWRESKNNFIIAQNFEHSLELRRMGFKEAYQKDGKIYMSVPVKYESFDAGTSVAKIKSDSFIGAKDITDKSKKLVHKVLSELGKFSGYNIEFVDKPELPFDSAMIVPDSQNGLNEATVVVNLAYANARTGAAGLGMVVVETMRKKATQDFNQLYKSILEDSKYEDMKDVFKKYESSAPKSLNDQDKQLYAMANLVQEMLDRVTTDAVGSGINFLTDFQERLTNAIRKQEGDYRLERLPLGENMLLALQSELGIEKGKKYELSDKADVEERKIIDRVASLVEKTFKSPSDRFKEFYSRFKNKSYPAEYTSKGYKQATILDAFEAAGFTIFTKEVRDYIDFQGSITEFLADDNLLEQIGNLYFSMIRVDAKQNPAKIGFLLQYPTSDANQALKDSFTKEEKLVYDFFNGYLKTQPASVMSGDFANLDTRFSDVLKSFFANDNRGELRIQQVIEHLTGDFNLSRYADVNERTFSIIRDIYRESMTDESLSTPMDILEDVYRKVQEADTKDSIVEGIKSAKSLREAIKIAKMSAPQVDINGAFTFRVEYDELKEFFSDEFKEKIKRKKKGGIKEYTGADTVFNEDAFMEIKIIPVFHKEGVFNVSYDVAYKGELSGFKGFPAGWGVRNMTMPVVFKYVNLMGAISNAKGINFSAVLTGINEDVVADFGEEAYSPRELKRLKESPSRVTRRGLNNRFAFRNGYMVNAKRSKNVAVELDGKLYEVDDNDVLSYITSDAVEVQTNSSIEEGNLMDVAELIGNILTETNKTDLIEKVKNSKVVDLKGKSIMSAALAINEKSFTLPHAEVIVNNYPMASAFKNDEKYVSATAIRSMLEEPMTPQQKREARSILESTDAMFESAENKILSSGKKLTDFVKNLFKKGEAREAFITTSSRLQKAMKKGFEDHIKAQFTALNGQRANADRNFQKAEKRIFGKLNTTEEVALDKIIMYRRVAQIDRNWDSRLLENKTNLESVEGRIAILKENLKKASKKEKARIQKELSNEQKIQKYYSEQVEKYSVRPLHPSGKDRKGSFKVMNLEAANLALRGMKEEFGAEKFNRLNERADMFFDEYRKILVQSYEAGLIDLETKNRFINDDYSPRVFLEKMFGETPSSQFEHMNLSDDQIAGIRNGSNMEIFTDARFLLNTSMRTVNTKVELNKLLNNMSEAAESMDYKMKDDTMRRAKYKTDKEGNIVEDTFGNRESEDADEGYKNVFYRKDGKKRAFQIKTELYNALMGIEDRNLISANTRRKASRISGTRVKKSLVTGLRPSFAFVATARGFVEVTRGRGVYDDYMFLPVMQAVAMMDFFKALPSAMRDGALVDDYFKHGGGMSFLTTQGRPEQIYKKKRSVARKLLGQYSPLKTGAKALAFLGEKAEIALRLAIYQRMLDKLEKTRPELTETQRKYLAVEEARLLADFSQGGYLTKDLDAVKPYINAAVQGTKGTVDYIKENPLMWGFKQIQAHGIHTALGFMTMSFLGKEEWEKIPAYIKNRYLLIPTFTKSENGQPQFIRIPKAHQFMFLDHLAVMDAEYLYYTSQGEEYNWELYEKDRNGDPTGYLSSEGFEMIDAIFGSLPAGDLIPEEIVTPSKLTLSGVAMQVLSGVPTLGALDAYYNNIDRYRDRKIAAEGKWSPYLDGQLDGRTRDIFKVTGKAFNASDKKMQAAFEKLYANESSLIVSLMYQITDALLTTDEERGEIQLLKDRKKKIDASLGLKRSFIYELPEKAYDRNLMKRFEDIDREGQDKKRTVRNEIRTLLENEEYDYKEYGKVPQSVIDYIKDIAKDDPNLASFAAYHAKSRCLGFQTDQTFNYIAHTVLPEKQVEMLKIIYEFDNYSDLPLDVRKEIQTGLIEAGLKNKKGLALELGIKESEFSKK